MILKIGGHIVYVRQEREAKDKPLKPVSYDAILLGQEAAEDGKVGAARLIFFHPRGASHLNSADWSRAFEYAEQVPFEPSGEFFHGFALAENDRYMLGLEAAIDQGSDALFAKDAEIAALQQTNTALNEHVAQLMEKLAEIKGEPSAADLDAVEAEKNLVIETKQYSDGSSATGVAPLPDQSPEQQAAAESA